MIEKKYQNRYSYGVLMKKISFQSHYSFNNMLIDVGKDSLAPLPSEVCDDQAILDKTLSDQVSSWKSSRRFSDEAVTGHTCTGHTCTYTQIGDVYICEKIGRVHVCEQTGGGICSEAVLDPTGNTLVCPVSGQIFDGWIDENVGPDNGEDMVGGVTDDADEPFMGSRRVARAFSLGYNCAGEEELEATLRYCSSLMVKSVLSYREPVFVCKSLSASSK